MVETTCCFTGHRKLNYADLPSIKTRLREELIRLIGEGVVCFTAGGAIGFDTLAEKTVIELKEEYPFIRLNLVLPCPEQAENWSARDKLIYGEILKKADEVVYASENYTPYCMMARNRMLVDGASICIAYMKRQTGGTAYTVSYAEKKNKTVINIAK